MTEDASDKTEEMAPKPELDSKRLEKEIRDLVGPWFEKNNMEEAIVIARPAGADSLVIFYRGHFFDVTAMLSHAYRQFRTTVANSLGE